MTVEEIFSTLAAHMQEGLLVHQQLADIYSFLNLCGYKKCHEYHYYEESRNYRCLCNFYMEQYYKLIPPKDPKTKTKELIPSSWYKYEKIDVDANTKRTAVKEMMQEWVNWEKETKKLLETSYKDLYEQEEICAAMKIAYFLEDVSKELKHAQKKQIDLDSSGYDLPSIIKEQKSLHKEYKKKIRG